MGKYLITSSESKGNEIILVGVKTSRDRSFVDKWCDNILVGCSKELFEKKDSKPRKLSSGEGGRWNCTRHKKATCSYNDNKPATHIRSTIILRTFFLLVFIAMILCGVTNASPTPSLNNEDINLEEIHREAHDIQDYNDFNEEDNGSRDTGFGNSQELDKLRKTIMDDLGMTKIPDPRKANVSQTEYENAHREYLRRVESSKGQDLQRTRRKLHVFYPSDPVFGYNTSRMNFPDVEIAANSMYFPVEIPSENHAVEHATLRILIPLNEGEKNPHNEDFVEVSVYQPAKSSPRRLVANQRVSAASAAPRWAEFDSTEAVASWFHDGEENLGFEVEIRRHGALVRWKEPATAALNVFTISDAREGARNRRATPDQLMSLHRGRRTECRGQNKKCCRHQMTVIFKDLKGFEFIIQPKDFDAGYCKGRCPPRYNPAHHHALLQSLIWKEDRKKAPRPCCAPSKLTELEILYFDENDSSKLKVSNWKNMKVLECACS